MNLQNNNLHFAPTTMHPEEVMQVTGFFISHKNTFDNLPHTGLYRAIQSRITESLKASGLAADEITEKLNEEGVSPGLTGLCFDALALIECGKFLGDHELQDVVFYALQALFIAGVKTDIQLNACFYEFTNGAQAVVEVRSVTESKNIMTLTLPRGLMSNFEDAELFEDAVISAPANSPQETAKLLEKYLAGEVYQVSEVNTVNGNEVLDSVGVTIGKDEDSLILNGFGEYVTESSVSAG